VPVPGRNRNRRLLAGVALAAMLASVAAAQAAPAAKHPGAAKPAALPAAGPPTVFASGLNSPRGLNFGPDGDLYVAEAGTGGDTSTADVCPDDQVVPPVGPYTGGDTARITKYAPDGTRTVVADGLPSATEALGARTATPTPRTRCCG
jgi:glucose/arabinose dehydrogenase